MRIKFEAGDGKAFGSVNYMSGRGNGLVVYAEVEVPEGASEDYGYLTMKEAILERLPNQKIRFQYDGQEQYLAEDASADCKVYIDIYD